jgi:hypothetical protein
MKILISIFLLVITLLSCNSKESKKSTADNVDRSLPFDLRSPSKCYELPKALHEISGIAAVNDSIIACIADEKGTVYFYNLKAGEIDTKLKFTEHGDFEDLTIVNDTIYVLDSRGVIWVIKNYLQQPQITSTPLTIEQPFELEGLCHRGDTLFIAAKYYHNKKRDKKSVLPVWRLDRQLQIKDPLFNLPDIIQVGGNTAAAPFHTSAIVYYEKMKQWFCTSTHTKAFIQCDYQGNILATQPLTEKDFSQPEGICFTMSGDLLISNEGKEGPGTILLFTHLKQ